MAVKLKAKWNASCAYAINSIWAFEYNGNGSIVKNPSGTTIDNTGKFTVPCNGYYKLEAWGAQGGDTNGYVGGYGGYAYGNTNLTKDSNLYVYVGGSGTGNVTRGLASGGYNGGGNGYGYSDGWHRAAGGGGATHIAASACGTLKYCQNNLLYVVAGGGGGAHWHSASAGHCNVGGVGGGTNGMPSTVVVEIGNSATGGSQTVGGISFSTSYENGSYGQGAGCNNNCSGGGGGYYGGGSAEHAGTGGGSGFIGSSLLINDSAAMYCYNQIDESSGFGNCTTSSNANDLTYGTNYFGSHEQNKANTGDGYVRITYLGTSI